MEELDPERRDTTAKRRLAEVQHGDTASSTATAARIGIARLGDLNPGVDAAALRPAQTLKLAP